VKLAAQRHGGLAAKKIMLQKYYFNNKTAFIEVLKIIIVI
jgi:hypothetical protein